MPKLKIFTAPRNYSDYSFRRAWHQEKAILVMFGAAFALVGRWLS